MQADTVDVLQVMAFAGGCTANQACGRYVPIEPEEIPELFARPHVIGLTKELALERMGSWASNLFVHEPPRFDLRPSEQTLLLAALRGGSDEELADELGVSRSAVKKTWRSIYERVAGCDANLLPQLAVDGDNVSARGKAKRHHLVSYLREHMQELRPVSRRLRKGTARHDYREPSEQREGINVLTPPMAGEIGAANLRRS
jgi:DNA-binding CsgD family transcriptional regulator